MNVRFDGRVVVVTGAADGIGRRVARDFCALGAEVHCCDVEADGLDEVRTAGAHPTRGDLTDRRWAGEWIASVEQRAGGPVDVLVNNAGGYAGSASRPLAEVPDAEWDGVFAANVDTAFTVSRAVVPGMTRAGRGRIVNISSGAGLRPARTRHHAYTAAKHAVVGLTRQMAEELGQYGITVNSVAPGLVLSTARARNRWDETTAEERRSHLRQVHMRRLGDVADISSAVLFLASDHASWITGQVVPVDGGQR